MHLVKQLNNDTIDIYSFYHIPERTQTERSFLASYTVIRFVDIITINKVLGTTFQSDQPFCK